MTGLCLCRSQSYDRQRLLSSEKHFEGLTVTAGISGRGRSDFALFMSQLSHDLQRFSSSHTHSEGLTRYGRAQRNGAERSAATARFNWVALRECEGHTAAAGLSEALLNDWRHC